MTRVVKVMIWSIYSVINVIIIKIMTLEMICGLSFQNTRMSRVLNYIYLT